MQYTGNLAELIATVEKEFSSEMAKSEKATASFAKGEDEKKDKKPSDSKPPEAKDKAPAAEAKPEEGAEDAPPAEGAPAPAEGAAPAPAAAMAPGADPAAAAGHGYDDEDMQHMQQMYASMSQEELMAHHDAIRAALDACSAAPAAPQAPGAPAPAAPGADPMMGKSEGNKKGHSELSQENPELNSKPKAGGKDMNNDPKNGGIEAAPPHNPVGARSEASKDSKNLKDAMAKTERERRNGGKIEASPVRNSPGAKSPASTDQGNLTDMEKSEKDFDLIKSELDAEKAKSADLKKNLDTVQEFLTKLVTKVAAPKGKAVTEIASLAKNEDGGSSVDTNSMSKSEITQKLLAKSADPRTSQADRAAINAYYLSNANVNTISHLLK